MGDIFEKAKTARLISGEGRDTSEFEAGAGDGDDSRRRGAAEAEEWLSHRRDIEMIGVLTERVANCERQIAVAQQEADEARARLKLEQEEHELSVARIEQLEQEQTYLRAECEVLRATAQRTFYAGSPAVYLKLGVIDQFERDEKEKHARRERIEDRIRRYVPRSLRKYVRRLLFGKS